MREHPGRVGPVRAHLTITRVGRPTREVHGYGRRGHDHLGGCCAGGYVTRMEKTAWQYLLSDNVSVMDRVHLEAAVFCPQINRVRVAGNASFVDLESSSFSALLRSDQGNGQHPPFRPTRCQRRGTRTRHTSSRSQSRGETWRGSDQMHRGKRRAQRGWSCGSSRLRGFRMYG